LLVLVIFFSSWFSFKGVYLRLLLRSCCCRALLAISIVFVSSLVIFLAPDRSIAQSVSSSNSSELSTETQGKGGQAAVFDNYVLRITPASQSITIDGKPTEEAWKKASSINNFFQHYPTDSLAARSQVEVRALYDNEYMYFAITCFDSTAGKYFFQSLRRDFSADESDGVMIILDPLGTGQNGFGFRVSPVGVQSEGFVSNGGIFGMDRSWDNVWFSEVHTESDRWTAEIAVPFRAIRFEGGRKRWRVKHHPLKPGGLSLNVSSGVYPRPRP
jgi:hypothetical protein